MSNVVVAEVWSQGITRPRVGTVILASFGLVGFGAIIGAGCVYYFYIRRKFEEQFTLHSTISSEIDLLRTEVRQLKSTLDLTQKQSTSKSSLKPAFRESRKDQEKRIVKFVNGYETADDDEYLTAGSSDSDEYTNSPLENNSREDESLGYSSGSGSGGGDFNRFVCQEKRFFSNVDKMFEGDAGTQHEAYISLKINQEKLKDSCDFWWRFAKATHFQATAAGNNGDQNLRKSLAFEGCEHAQKALQLNENSADAHKWFAITLGSKGDFLGVNEKIQNGFLFKKHIDKAIELNATDSTLYHLLGRFCFEVSQLSWIERRVASSLFSAPPTSDPTEALAHFETAERIGKPFKENRLFIAKCHIALNDSKSAAQWLSYGSCLPVISAGDKGAQEEIAKLLPKYGKYLPSK